MCGFREKIKSSDNNIYGPMGVDLDNTIVSYDAVLFAAALEFNLIESSNTKAKKAIRDTVQRLPEGEIKWQKLQAEIYGPRMIAAELIDGVNNFFIQCSRKSIPVYIISHKTKFANYGSTDINLRETALKWLNANNFFDKQGMGLGRSNVYFESTRQDKITRIRNLGCKYFIDDLEEIFVERTFPINTNKILFDRHNEYESRKNVRICNTWSEITELIFGKDE
jgi:hypothetical protein